MGDVNVLAMPSLVIPLEIDSELAAERLMNVPGVFQFKLPPPEEDENGDIIPLTKAEIKELQETQSEEEKARLSELSASTSERCESIKNLCEENNIAIAATIMANVSKNLI